MSKNVAAIRALYEDAFHKLHLQMQSIIKHGELPSEAEEGVKTQVRWIHDVARTLLVVNGIENARKKDPAKPVEDSPQPVMPPAPKPTGQRTPMPPGMGLDQFHSPGWQPGN